MLIYATLYSALLYCTLLYPTLLYYTRLHHTILYILCCAMLYCTVPPRLSLARAPVAGLQGAEDRCFGEVRDSFGLGDARNNLESQWLVIMGYFKQIMVYFGVLLPVISSYLAVQEAPGKPSGPTTIGSVYPKSSPWLIERK